jgi:hypothetical protein
MTFVFNMLLFYNITLFMLASTPALFKNSRSTHESDKASDYGDGPSRPVKLTLAWQDVHPAGCYGSSATADVPTGESSAPLPVINAPRFRTTRLPIR